VPVGILGTADAPIALITGTSLESYGFAKAAEKN
jgi:hypothetical protein